MPSGRVPPVAFGISTRRTGCGPMVTHQQRHALARAFGLGVGREVVAFGGESHAEQRPRPGARRLGHSGEDVGVFGESELRHVARPVFLDLVFASAVGPPVGHGGRGDEYVGELGLRLRGVQHVLRRFHVDACHPARRGQAHRPCDQRDVGAGFARRPCNGETHLAAGQVGDAAHRIDRFESGAGRDQHLFPASRLGWKKAMMSSSNSGSPACGRRRFRRKPGSRCPRRGCARRRRPTGPCCAAWPDAPTSPGSWPAPARAGPYR